MMLRSYSNPRLLPVLFFGFLSALPVPLTGSVLTAWLAEEHVAKALIGLLALFECPFALKPLFWPLINRVSIPFLTEKLGRRRSWALISFVGAACSLMVAALIKPSEHLLCFYACMGICSAFSGCIYLIGIAYEIENLSPDEYAGGSACVIFGYRLGLVAAGAGALFLASYYSWAFAYLIVASGMILGVLLLMIAPEPKYTLPKPAMPELLVDASPFKKICGLIKEDVLYPAFEFFKRREWGWILLFVLFFRTADNLIEGMSTPFYIDLGITKLQLASAAKVNGMMAAIAGSMVGGYLVSLWGLQPSLMIFGLIHACRFLFYLGLLWFGPNYSFFFFAEIFNHFSGGMIMTAFIAALWQFTTQGKAAPQYALLWSAISIKTKLFAFIGAVLAQVLSWEIYFTVLWCVAICASFLPLFLYVPEMGAPPILAEGSISAGARR